MTPKERDTAKLRIKHCEKFRYTNEEILLDLEDNGIDISLATLTILKRELREDLKKRFEEIGKHELAYEHDLAIQILPYLEQQMLKIFQDPEASQRDKIAASSEIRNLKRDMLEFHSRSEIVQNVFQYFEEKYGESGKEAVKKVKDKIESKASNKASDIDLGIDD